ncbi:MAG: glycosyltransferase [Roseimicrobium sp.]
MLPSPLERHLQLIRAFYSVISASGCFAKAYRRELAAVYRTMIPADASVLEVGCGDGGLLDLLPNQDITGVDVAPESIELARKTVPRGAWHVAAGEGMQLERKFDVIILSDLLNVCYDAQDLLRKLHEVSHADTRLLINAQNAFWLPFLKAAEFLRLKRGQPMNNWLSPRDVADICGLADWEPVKQWAHMALPLPLLGLNRFVNRWLSPLVGGLCLSRFTIARPRLQAEARRQDVSVSIVIPARNEAGNIQAALDRMPQFASRLEVIFVEGGSSDNTWEEVQRVCAEGRPGLELLCLKQPGKGKGDAVRAGFTRATGDMLMILDADLTVPPEDLPRFYNAIVSGKTDFANGSRLVYPMESQAMQFANLVANHFFAVAFSWVMRQRVKDTLCGTKVLSRKNYERLVAQRAYFGEFDPFGDFDLLFGADKLGLKILDIPIHYKDRTYGSTNIHRWRHGVILLRMLLVGARRLRFI